MTPIETQPLQGADGTRLYRETRLPAGPPRAHVLLVHGFGDHVGRYDAFLNHLAAEGFAAHGFDYRGHGRAEGRRGHCAAYSDLVGDLEAALATVPTDRPRFLYVHSHGGLMAAYTGITRGLPDVAGVVFSAPWFQLAFTPPRWKLTAARWVGKVLPTAPFDSEIRFDQLSRDAAWQEATRMDPLYGRTITPSWFFAALAAQRQVLAEAAAFRVPFAMHHGSADTIASPEASRAFHDAAGATDKSYTRWPDFRHELAHEIGREAYWRAVTDWIGARCG